MTINSLRESYQGWSIAKFGSTFSNILVGQVEIYGVALNEIQIHQNFDLNRNIYGL
jgi:hypothetical protein